MEELARNVLRDPLRITVGERSAASDLVQQRLLYVGSEEGKLLGLRQLLSQGVQPPLLVFVQSQDRAEQLFKTLRYEKLNVDVLHGGSSAGHRDGGAAGDVGAEGGSHLLRVAGGALSLPCSLSEPPLAAPPRPPESRRGAGGGRVGRGE